jgi:hypothetical protein
VLEKKDLQLGSDTQAGGNWQRSLEFMGL